MRIFQLACIFREALWLKSSKEAGLYGVICFIIPSIIGTLISGLFLKWKNSPTVLLTFQNLLSLILLSAAISTKCGNQMVEGLFEEKSGEIVPLRKPIPAFHGYAYYADGCDLITSNKCRSDIFNPVCVKSDQSQKTFQSPCHALIFGSSDSRFYTTTNCKVGELPHINSYFRDQNSKVFEFALDVSDGRCPAVGDHGCGSGSYSGFMAIIFISFTFSNSIISLMPSILIRSVSIMALQIIKNGKPSKFHETN